MNENNKSKIIMLIENIVLYPIFLISCLTLKSKKIWIFSSWHGQSISDNPKALYDYATARNELDQDIKLIWITKTRNIPKFDDSIRCYYAYGILGIYYQCRAKVVVYSDSVTENYFAQCICPWVYQIQTWHGMPIKKIRDDVHHRNNGFIKTFMRLVFPYRYDHPNIIVSTTKNCEKHLANAFGTTKEKILSSGYPRNDQLLTDKASTSVKKYKVLYAPTYRDDGLHKSAIENLIDQFQQKVKDKPIELYLKLHPSVSSILDPKWAGERVKLIHSDINLNEILSQFDLLISDYSGCIVDYLLLDRPIILYPYDLDKYVRSHGVYDYFSLFLKGLPVAFDENELIRKIETSFCETGQSKMSQELKYYFHDFHDSNSSERLYDATIRNI